MKSHLLTLTAAVLAIFAFSSCKRIPATAILQLRLIRVS